MDSILKGKTILIAEDEPAMLSALTEKFEGEGSIVLQAPDGEVAVDMVVKHKPDLMLLDVLMPKATGKEVLVKIREAGITWGGKFPIIVLTNFSEHEDIAKDVIGYWPTYYLVKTDWKLKDIVEKAKSCFADVKNSNAG